MRQYARLLDPFTIILKSRSVIRTSAYPNHRPAATGIADLLTRQPSPASSTSQTLLSSSSILFNPPNKSMATIGLQHSPTIVHGLEENMDKDKAQITSSFISPPDSLDGEIREHSTNHQEKIVAPGESVLSAPIVSTTIIREASEITLNESSGSTEINTTMNPYTTKVLLEHVSVDTLKTYSSSMSWSHDEVILSPKKRLSLTVHRIPNMLLYIGKCLTTRWSFSRGTPRSFKSNMQRTFRITISQHRINHHRLWTYNRNRKRTLA